MFKYCKDHKNMPYGAQNTHFFPNCNNLLNKFWTSNTFTDSKNQQEGPSQSVGVLGSKVY